MGSTLRYRARIVGKPRETYPDPDPAADSDPSAKAVRSMKHANSNQLRFKNTKAIKFFK